MDPRRWFHEHSLKLLAIRDTPEAIAGGVAIGIFIGFTPLFGLKTVLTIFFAWLTGSNIIAAVIASAAHDVPAAPDARDFPLGVRRRLLALEPAASLATAAAPGCMCRGIPGGIGQPSSRSENRC